MPTFTTPDPITLRFRLSSGEIRVQASARNETEVEVLPSNSSRSEDVQAASETLVEQRDGTVVVEVPENGRRFGRSASVDIRVALPEGSNLRGTVASADLTADGRYGDVEVTSASGDLRIDEVAGLSVTTASGDVFIRAVDGDARMQTASGDISVPKVGGRAQVSTASGDVDLGDVGGDVRLQGASGDLQVHTAGGSVETKTASGDVKIGSVRQGDVSADAASGDIEIGVAAGTAAWLDVSSLSGDVHSSLDQAGEPGSDEATVSVRARTLSGDISIVRAH
jgi:DUF4097 and DUF4098 domain-containing protein YvlB